MMPGERTPLSERIVLAIWRLFPRPAHERLRSDIAAMLYETRDEDGHNSWKGTLLVVDALATLARAWAVEIGGRLPGRSSGSLQTSPGKDPRWRATTDGILQDLRHSVRSLRRSPGFAAVAIVTLGLGIGANIAMFGLVDALLFRLPEHVRDPRGLVSVRHARNYVDYLGLARSARTLDVAAYTKRELSLGRGTDAIPIQVECVTQSYFPVLGLQPMLGRSFTKGEETVGGQRVAVLDHGLWQSRFGGDPSVIGESLTISGHNYDVVGITPRGFTGAQMESVDAWILLTSSPEECSFTGTDLLAATRGAWLKTIGRIRDGFALAHAEAEISGLSSSGERPMSEAVRESLPASALEPFYEPTTDRLSREGRVALWLSVGSTLVFVIACLNVAGLLSIQAIERRGEIAMRFQLGATRMRVVRQMVTENLVLAFSCVLVAWLVGIWIRMLLEGFFPQHAAAGLFNTRLFGVMAGFIFLAAIFTGTTSAMPISRVDPGRVLRGGTSLVSEGSKLRNVLLIGQITLAFVLVVCSGLFLRSVENVMKDPGYDVDRVIMATVDLRKAGYGFEEQRSVFNDLLDRVLQLSDVEYAGFSSHSMILGAGGAAFSTGIRGAPDRQSEQAIYNAISPQYFATLGTPVLRGRAFESDDSSSPVAVVDTDLAARLWPNEDPIGQCAWMGADCYEVVGLIPSRRHSTITRVNHEFFVPILQEGRHEGLSIPKALFIRAGGSPKALIPQLVTALQSVDEDLPFVNVRLLSELAVAETLSWRLGATVFGVFGMLAVVLAGIGVYGVLALSVRQRTAQIGLCMALGANPLAILSRMLRDGLILVGVGFLGGVGAALAVTRFIRSFLFEVTPTDPSAFLAASLIIGLMALAGCVFPAARAARVDPAVALRGE